MAASLSVESLENYHKPVGRCLGAAVMEEIYIKAAGASPRPTVFGNKIPSSVAVPSIENLENYHKPVGAIHESPASSDCQPRWGGFCAIARNSHNPIDKPPILCYSIIEKESDRTWKSPRSEWRKRSEGCSESAGRFVHFYPERKIS